MRKLRVAGIKEESLVDGPGIRMTLFVQGCPFNCYGCHNPEARDPEKGVEMETREIIKRLDEHRGLDGVTFSGGEPFMQPVPLAEIGKEARQRELHLMTYTGYTFEELMELGLNHPPTRELLWVTEVLVDGPYRHDEKDVTLAFRGSRNQRLINVPLSLEKGVPVIFSDAGASLT